MGDFTFPVLREHVKDEDMLPQPLTARSTVTQPTEEGGATSAVSLEPAIVPPDFKRQKVPLEKGFSQMDWMRLSQRGRDLEGRPLNGEPGGRRRRHPVPMHEVQAHNTVEDGWTVIQGIVYNVSPYLRFHPGGAKILKLSVGKDGTNLFNKYHRWVNAPALLEKCIIGRLEVDKDDARGEGEQTAAPSS